MILATAGTMAAISGNEAVTVSANVRHMRDRPSCARTNDLSEQATAARIVAQVAQSGNVVLDQYLIGPPDNPLPAGRGLAEVGVRSR